MAIPEEKNLAVQLVVTVAFCVVPFALIHALWYMATGVHPSLWIAGAISILVGVAFFWLYGYAQEKNQQHK